METFALQATAQVPHKTNSAEHSKLKGSDLTLQAVFADINIAKDRFVYSLFGHQFQAERVG